MTSPRPVDGRERKYGYQGSLSDGRLGSQMGKLKLPRICIEDQTTIRCISTRARLGRTSDPEFQCLVDSRWRAKLQRGKVRVLEMQAERLGRELEEELQEENEGKIYVAQLQKDRKWFKDAVLSLSPPQRLALSKMSGMIDLREQIRLRHSKIVKITEKDADMASTEEAVGRTRFDTAREECKLHAKRDYVDIWNKQLGESAASVWQTETALASLSTGPSHAHNMLVLKAKRDSLSGSDGYLNLRSLVELAEKHKNLRVTVAGAARGYAHQGPGEERVEFLRQTASLIEGLHNELEAVQIELESERNLHSELKKKKRDLQQLA